MQARLARLRALSDERTILVGIALRRLQHTAGAFTAHRRLVAAVLQAHQATLRRDADAATAARALQRFDHSSQQLAEQAEALFKDLTGIHGDLDALEQHTSNLLDAAGAVQADAEKSCLPATQVTGKLLVDARNYAERARRAVGGVREVTDAASVGFVAVPSLAPAVSQESLRLRQLQGVRALPVAPDAVARAFREHLGAASARLARLEASMAAAPGRLSIEFPQPLDIDVRGEK